MKAKYIFTKYGSRRSDLEISDIIPETDQDYDVADIFLTDQYSDEGESISYEAESLEDAIYFANHYFGTCISPKNIQFSYDCYEKFVDLALALDDPLLISRIPESLFKSRAPYVPAPVKIDTKWGKYTNKRYRKFYQKQRKSDMYSPSSLVFDYGYSWRRD